MNSNDLKKYNFINWYKFNLKNKENLLKILPKEMGVYVIRYKNEFGRFFSRSDIVYIGSTIHKNGLRQRIKFYFKPGPTQWTSKRIHKWLEKIDDFEISFIIISNREHVRSKERELLRKYENEHGELPPFNRNVAK